jgi:ferric-dicitrate binding protein FerR (iron transport regulator)
VLVDGNEEFSTPAATLVEESLGWIDGTIVFNDRPFREVLPALQRWYALTLTPESPALLDRRVTMRAGVDSMRAALRALQLAGQVIIDYDAKTNRVWDAAARPTRR